jgi:predicted transcriptional regulator
VASNSQKTGKVNRYYPLVKKETYSKSQLSVMMKDYFNNSFASMVSFFAKENNFTMEELDKLLDETREALRREKDF